MSYPNFNADERTIFGSKASCRMRDAGQVPVAISRSGGDSRHIQVGTVDAESLMGLRSRVVTFSVGGETVQAVIKDATRHPVEDHILHIDALEVTDDKLVKVAVPVTPIPGNCPGLKAGGLLEQMLRKVVIKCQAGSIPDNLTVELNDVELTESVYASAVSLPEGAKLITPPRTALLTIIKTRGMRRAESVGEGEEEA